MKPQPAPAAAALRPEAPPAPKASSTQANPQGGGGERNKANAGNASIPGKDKGPTETPQANTRTGPTQSATYTPAKSVSASWEQVGQYALNASILSGRFEDLRILAFSGRIPPDRVGAPRVLYANSRLVASALPNVFQYEGLNEVPDTELAAHEDILYSAANFDYSDDSDLDDLEPEEAEKERTTSARRARDVKGNRAERVPGDTVASDPPRSTRTPPTTHSTNERDQTKPEAQSKAAHSSAESAASSARAPSPADTDDFVSVSETATPQQEQEHRREGDRQKQTAKQPEVNVGATPSSRPAANGQRTIVATDTAYRTWRAVVFWAYTGRIAFAPLRSQGLPFAPMDLDDDPSQLPICSPKSVYRLAIKYGNKELEQLAGNDIASKLSTQNALTELFSRFTSRHPQIQEMELNFVLLYLKHPDITVRLPTWIDRFARGELPECADTFGRLIHKLACAATAPPSGRNDCPRGCAMATIQHRCGMCGTTFI
ncbi:uncharacterized protein TRAVEDRAFT_34275 [Trametes versicolor FP-101664 SS1]|uniref:uncharacterized protein n=1 Tax=Trametes versicolor (strain FP-101664) TaxID=717944 RepID=UPI00046231A2|nr:uncharacterized protein TRAVEDRAFT_34275 [Trametes versicolor FP-101664 SS1]EIW63019.1 hypothetical protein TRAVEDRAFT_34275 [Trametes versicolor FP-101664 SS1]